MSESPSFSFPQKSKFQLIRKLYAKKDSWVAVLQIVLTTLFLIQTTYAQTSKKFNYISSWDILA